MPEAKLDFGEFDETTKTNMLNFLNYYSARRVRDDPTFTTGESPFYPDYGVGQIVSNRIASVRQKKGGVFWHLSDIADVKYFGQDKLRDLAYSTTRLDSQKLSLFAPQISRSNIVEVFVDGPECLSMILQEISLANKYIHLSVMLFFNDTAGNLIANALAMKAREGIEVRVIADSKATASGYYSGAVEESSHADFSKVADVMREAGVKVVDSSEESYWEWEWDNKRRQLEETGVPEEFLFVQDLVQDDVQLNCNVVYHRKFLIIDGHTSIIASFNIGDQYLYSTQLIPQTGNPHGVPSHPNQWHDGCFRIKGDFANLLERLFASQWMVLPGGDFYTYQSSFYRSQDHTKGPDDCALFMSFPGNPINRIRQYYIGLLEFSDGNVIIENPYIIDNEFWSTLSHLSPQRAKLITICNPFSNNDARLNKPAIKCNGWQAVDNGVLFYDYFNGARFSHWKIALDKTADCVFYGSYNLNYRSALHDFETCILVKSQNVSERISSLLEYDLAISNRLERDTFFQHPLLHPSCYFEELFNYFS